jgi:hypothetical protein
MGDGEFSELEQLKITLLAEGIRVDPSAERELSSGGRLPLTIHEYATTGGVTLVLGDRVYINAPFDEWWCDRATASLHFDEADGGYSIRFPGGEVAVRALPLPGYLEARDSQGRLVRDTAMSHADRVRLSPIDGCAYTCRFCDLAGKKYTIRPAEQMLESLAIARNDATLPAVHAMVSGGTPGRRHEPYFDEVLSEVLETSDLPLDVMMTPRHDSSYVDRYVARGLRGFSLNLEVYDDEVAKRVIPEKQRLGRKVFAENVERAVRATGGGGRVRSLILVGLEEEKTTLEGVELIASLGADPVLSPFRPSANTALERMEPPSAELLRRVYLESREIVERHGVKLGPRCIPCQHNTLTFPDAGAGYYFS